MPAKPQTGGSGGKYQPPKRPKLQPKKKARTGGMKKKGR